MHKYSFYQNSDHYARLVQYVNTATEGFYGNLVKDAAMGLYNTVVYSGEGLLKVLSGTVRFFSQYNFDKRLSLTKEGLTNIKKMNKIHQELLIANLADKRAYAPVHCSVSYATYLSTLKVINNNYLSGIDEELKWYQRELSFIINESKLSDKYYTSLEYLEKRRDKVTQYKELLGTMHASNTNTEGVVLYQDVIEKENDWNTCAVLMEDIINNHKKVNVVALNKTTHNISKLYQKIYSSLEDQAEVDSALASFLVTSSKHLAEVFEFYSAIRYQLDVVYKSIQDTAKELLESLDG